MLLPYDLNEVIVLSDKIYITQKPPKGEDGYKVFSIRIKNELVDKLEDISAKSGRSRNELIGIFLDYAVKNCVIDEG